MRLNSVVQGSHEGAGILCLHHPTVHDEDWLAQELERHVFAHPAEWQQDACWRLHRNPPEIERQHILGWGVLAPWTP
jgi:hypothetical protein